MQTLTGHHLHGHRIADLADKSGMSSLRNQLSLIWLVSVCLWNFSLWSVYIISGMGLMLNTVSNVPSTKEAKHVILVCPTSSGIVCGAEEFQITVFSASSRG
jgi:hypothetical protein